MKTTKSHLKLYGYVLPVTVTYINKSELKAVFNIKPVKQYVRKGYSHKGGTPYKKDHRYTQAIELRQQGKTYQQIADIPGISKSQIYKWLNNPNYN